MSWDPDNIVRSVRRYVTDMLGPPWAIDLEREELADADRPGGVIEVGAEQVRFIRRSVPQGNVQAFMPVTLTLYPSLAEPREAGRTARHLSNALARLIAVGASELLQVNGRPGAGPEVLPLYDYSDVPLHGTIAQRRGPARPFTVMWAEDYSTRPLQDPQDPQRWSVILEMRVSYEYAGRATPDGPIVERMPGGYLPGRDPRDQTGDWDGVFIPGEVLPGP